MGGVCCQMTTDTAHLQHPALTCTPPQWRGRLFQAGLGLELKWSASWSRRRPPEEPEGGFPCQTHESNHYWAETKDELLVKVSKAQKVLNLFHRRGCRPVSDCLSLLGVHLERALRENESQGDHFGMELALLWLNIQVIPQEAFQDLLCSWSNENLGWGPGRLLGH